MGSWKEALTFGYIIAVTYTLSSGGFLVARSEREIINLFENHVIDHFKKKKKNQVPQQKYI